jgi:chromosome segregation ATPase
LEQLQKSKDDRSTLASSLLQEVGNLKHAQLELQTRTLEKEGLEARLNLKEALIAKQAASLQEFTNQAALSSDDAQKALGLVNQKNQEQVKEIASLKEMLSQKETEVAEIQGKLSATSDDLNVKLKNIQQDFENAKQKINELDVVKQGHEKQILRLQSINTALDRDLKDANTNLETGKRNYITLKTQTDDMQKELQTKDNSVADLRRDNGLLTKDNTSLTSAVKDRERIIHDLRQDLAKGRTVSQSTHTLPTKEQSQSREDPAYVSDIHPQSGYHVSSHTHEHTDSESTVHCAHLLRRIQTLVGPHQPFNDLVQDIAVKFRQHIRYQQNRRALLRKMKVKYSGNGKISGDDFINYVVDYLLSPPEFDINTKLQQLQLLHRRQSDDE